MKKVIFSLAIIASTIISCSKSSPADEYPVKGADLGWLSEMEHDSMLFYNESGEAVDCIDLFKASGMNAVRLRVWVNHATGWSNLPDVLSMAERVSLAQLPLMIDLHYSDFFADPQRQDIPSAWQEMSHEQLCAAVSAHTTEVLIALKEKGIYPKWVQIGNETTYGMMWPDGQLDKEEVDADAYREKELLSREIRWDWRRLAELSNAGYDAAKAVMPDIICITHVDNAFIPRVNWFNRFRSEGGKWDMIGLSHYPFTQPTKSWQEMNSLCAENISELYAEFGCPIMVVEIGTKTDEQPEESEACIRDFRKLMATTEGYAGVFYWEPEVYGYWRPQEYIPLGWGSYNMGCMTADGKLSPAAYALFE